MLHSYALFLRVAALATLAAIPTYSQTYTFKPVRITAGGYIPAIIAHPTQPGLLYARTDIGSVYRWDNPGAQWIPLTDFNSPQNYNLNGPESVALDPNDPQRLYIAAGMYLGGPSAFLVSTDQGQSFQINPAPFQMAANNDGRSAGERLAVNPFSPNELLMGTRQVGLWLSQDYAATWKKVTNFPVQSSGDGFGVQWVVYDPVHSGVIYVGSFTSAGVYWTQDGGADWSAVPNQPTSWPFPVSANAKPPAPQRALINPDGNLYVVFADFPGPNSMNYGLLEQFNPATAVWTNVTPPYDTADGQKGARGGFAGLTQDLSRQGTVAVSTLDRWYPVDTVYITHDGGANWLDLAKITSSNGVNGLPYGNFYFDPYVIAGVSPWLTFGGVQKPNGPVPVARFGWWMSALLFDPTNPDHLLFGTGATIYATNNVSAADSGTPPTWYVQGAGIEETAVLALISPTDGAHLISGVGDIGGFRHDDFTISPANGMFNNPVATTIVSLDWAGQLPSYIVRSQSPSNAGTSPCTYGAFSTSGGTDWQPFPSCATGVNSGGGGTVTVDSAGAVLMWTPGSGSANRPQYSTDSGATWTPVSGLFNRIVPTADKVTPGVFYAFDQNAGTGGFYSSGDTGGRVFAKVNSSPLLVFGGCSGSGCGKPVANWANAGDLWLPLGNFGLYHSIDSGVTWAAVSGVSRAYSFAIGATAPGSSVQSVFLYGVAAPLGMSAIYRSDDNGLTWLCINDDRHQYGGPTLIQADPRIFGRVYLGMNGRGIIYGDMAGTDFSPIVTPSRRASSVPH